ncbi:VOC family protein, partial [Actinoplanes sp. NPDC049802]|uniref:VOC family protein n=1 Tax=Actinoplanes sp. NPDC049802 TaxID=3154742 RepID=UPI0033D2D859
PPQTVTGTPTTRTAHAEAPSTDREPWSRPPRTAQPHADGPRAAQRPTAQPHDDRWARPTNPAPTAAPQPTTAPPVRPQSPWAEPQPPEPTPVPPDVDAHPLGSRTRFFMQPDTAPTTAEARAAEIPDPTPVAFPPHPRPERTSATPSPVTTPPTAPAPDRPFPSAPPPTTSGPSRDQIDIPLDLPLRGNPEPPPEATAQAAPAVADGIVAPPAKDTSALRDGILGVAVGRAAVSPHLEGGPWGDFSGRSEPDEHAADVITAYPSARPGPAGTIHGVGITILVTELERSTEFYRDVLGFHEIDNGDGSAVLASGDTRLVLRTVPNLSSEAGRQIYLNLEVGDIEAVHAELREKGVKFVHSPRPVNRGDKLELWSATFRDPDNHNIAITQWRAIR